MVYESDFYTTRRPYSSSRPYVSSYSVTVRAIPHMPYTAHRKLVTIVRTVPVRLYHAGLYWPVVRTIRLHTRVRPSIIAAELNRIRYLTRPSYVSHVEQYLNSKGFTDFDDEAKDIRAKTAKLLRKIHVFVPRPSISDYEEHTLPERLRSDDYVRRIINAKNAKRDLDMPWYSSPEKRSIGEGHLACIKYAGGRPQAKRRSYYTVSDLVPGDVRSDVNLMSYYLKNRKAAEDASPLIIHHHSVPIREDLDVEAATTITWADEIVHEEEIVVEPPAAAEDSPKEPELTESSQVKPEKKKKKEKKLKAAEQQESTEEDASAAAVVVAAAVAEAVEAPESTSLADTPAAEAVAADAEAEVVYDQDAVQKTPDDDTIKRVQEYIEKKAAEKKMEEERRAWELDEARKHAEALEIARLAKIKEEEDIRIAEMKEQERLEAERRAILDRAEELRKEAERLKEDEKLFNVAIQQAIADEKERVAQEEEEFLRRQIEEDKEAPDVEALNEVAIADEPHSEEEHSLHADLSDQEVEAKPYELDHDEDTQIEEDEHEEPTELENPFADGEGAAVAVQADEGAEDAPTVRTSGGAGDEGGFDWSEIDEPQVEESKAEAEAPQAEEEVEEASADNQESVELEEEQKQAEVEEARVEEEEEAPAEEAPVEEEEEIKEEAQETQAEEEVNIWEDVTEETTSSWRRTSTFRQEEAEVHIEEEARAEESDGGVQIEEIHEDEVKAQEEEEEEEEEQVTEETQVEDKSEKSVHDASEEEEVEEDADDE